jgi:hypothetical protein
MRGGERGFFERTRLCRLNRAKSRMVDNPEVIQFMVDGMINERSSHVVPDLAGKESSAHCAGAVPQSAPTLLVSRARREPPSRHDRTTNHDAGPATLAIPPLRLLTFPLTKWQAPPSAGNRSCCSTEIPAGVRKR